jgi:predicted nuclease of predicted toxin-antitoxin system
VRWLVDECVDAALVRALRESDHDALYISEIAPRTPDTAVLSKSAAEGRLLLTDDKDFGDLVFRRGLVVPGLVLLRIAPWKYEIRRIRLRAPEKFGEALSNRYTVVEKARFRIRRLIELP